MAIAPELRPLDKKTSSSWRTLGRILIRDRGFPLATSGPLPMPGTDGEVDADGQAGTTDQVSASIRLFAHHEELDARAVAEALRPLRLSDLEKTGLVQVDGTRVSARFGIERWGPAVVLHDWPEWGEDPNFVMGVTNSTRSLAYVTPRQHVGSVLDLGTGSGIEAVLAARHSDHVVATDVNDRAVALARATALLNNAENIEVRKGSWFEPVEGERFDLIVTNPPFVISPEDRLVYRDGGLEADDLCREIVADFPGHLAPCGFAVMMAQWARRTGEDWSSTPIRWLDPLDVDGIAIRYGAMTPREYAVIWNQFTNKSARERHRTVSRWVEYYDQLGLDQIYEGALAVMSHPSHGKRPPHRWVVPASRTLDAPGGDQLRRVLNGHVSIEGATTVDLLTAVPRPVDGHSLYQQIRFEDGQYVMGQIRCGFDQGLGIDTSLTPEELPLVLSIDGVHTVTEILDALAPQVQLEPDHAASVVTRLVLAGLLELPVRS